MTAGAAPEPFRDCLAALFPAAPVVTPETVEQAPADKGAYALLLHLDGIVDFVRPGLTHRFPPGWYVYAGSAFGPGGIRARLRRHFRRDKKRHWHIDDLTDSATRLHAVALVGGTECAIVARLSGPDRLAPALAGFGSSDCRICVTHLLGWTGGAE